MSRGKFITLEGIDGAGKSTHVGGIADLLRGRGKDIVVTREPGGTPLGEKLRALVLSQTMDIDTEALLMFAARREHIARVIAPALASGRLAESCLRSACAFNASRSWRKFQPSTRRISACAYSPRVILRTSSSGVTRSDTW